MTKYKIGIIEDSIDERTSIKRTIDYNKKNDDEIEFTDYDINLDNINVECFNEQDIVDLIIEDIIKEKIYMIIIDNKLINSEYKIVGRNIYDRIKNIIEDFPVIIMTNYKEEIYNENSIDPDKIYDKESFFLNKEYTQEKVRSIFLSIERYLKLKNEIISNKDALIRKYEQGTIDDEMSAINCLLEVEKEMKKYTPVDTSYLEELISPEYVKEIIDYLNEIQSKVE